MVFRPVEYQFVRVPIDLANWSATICPGGTQWWIYGTPRWWQYAGFFPLKRDFSEYSVVPLPLRSTTYSLKIWKIWETFNISTAQLHEKRPVPIITCVLRPAYVTSLELQTSGFGGWISHVPTMSHSPSISSHSPMGENFLFRPHPPRREWESGEMPTLIWIFRSLAGYEKPSLCFFLSF